MVKAISVHPSPAVLVNNRTAARVFLAKKGGSRRSTRVMLAFLTGEFLRIYPSNKNDNAIHSPTVYCIGLVLTISVCRRISNCTSCGGSALGPWSVDVGGANKRDTPGTITSFTIVLGGPAGGPSPSQYRPKRSYRTFYRALESNL